MINLATKKRECYLKRGSKKLRLTNRLLVLLRTYASSRPRPWRIRSEDLGSR